MSSFTNHSTSSPTSSRPTTPCSSEHASDDEGTQIRPRSLRERRGFTLFVHIEPPKYRGPAAGKPEPLVVNPAHSYSYSSGKPHGNGGLSLQNLPRRRRPSAAPQPAPGL